MDRSGCYFNAQFWPSVGGGGLQMPFWNCRSDFRFFFSFFAAFRFFWITVPVTQISTQNSFWKVCFWCWVHMDPLPLTTNGHTEDLDHLSVNLKTINLFKVLKLYFWTYAFIDSCSYRVFPLGNCTFSSNIRRSNY